MASRKCLPSYSQEDSLVIRRVSMIRSGTGSQPVAVLDSEKHGMGRDIQKLSFGMLTQPHNRSSKQSRFALR